MHNPKIKGAEARFRQSLLAGNEFSRKQVMHLFKLKNPSAALHRFQKNGDFVGRYSVVDKKTGKRSVRYWM